MTCIQRRESSDKWCSGCRAQVRELFFEAPDGMRDEAIARRNPCMKQSAPNVDESDRS